MTARHRLLAEVPAAFARGVCGALGACCRDLELAFDLASCEAKLEADLSRSLEESAGLDFDFDAQAAAACIEDYADAACADGPREPFYVKRNCELMFRGRRAPGEPCSDEIECRARPGEDAYCDFQSDGASGVCAVSRRVHAGRSAPCGGTCRPVDGSPTEACLSFAAAPSDVPDDASLPFCYTSDGLQCSGEPGQRTCQPLVEVGSSCAGNSVACVKGAFCNWETSMCEERRSSGLCDGLQDTCSESSICDAEQRTCIFVGKPAGSACDADADCWDDYCNPAGVCQQRLTAASCLGSL